MKPLTVDIELFHPSHVSDVTQQSGDP